MMDTTNGQPQQDFSEDSDAGFFVDELGEDAQGELSRMQALLASRELSIAESEASWLVERALLQDTIDSQREKLVASRRESRRDRALEDKVALLAAENRTLSDMYNLEKDEFDRESGRLRGEVKELKKQTEALRNPKAKRLKDELYAELRRQNSALKQWKKLSKMENAEIKSKNRLLEAMLLLMKKRTPKLSVKSCVSFTRAAKKRAREDSSSPKKKKRRLSNTRTVHAPAGPGRLGRETAEMAETRERKRVDQKRKLRQRKLYKILKGRTILVKKVEDKVEKLQKVEDKVEDLRSPAPKSKEQAAEGQ